MATGHDMDGVRGSDHITALLASCPHKSQLRGYWLPRGIAAHREFAACLTHDDYSLVDKRGRADGEKPGAHQLQKDTNVDVAVAVAASRRHAGQCDRTADGARTPSSE